MKLRRSLLLLALVGLGTSAGCTLITDVDRSLIPGMSQGGGGAGGEPSAGGTDAGESGGDGGAEADAGE